LQLWDVLKPEPYYILHHFDPSRSKTRLWLRQQALLAGLLISTLLASFAWLALVRRVVGGEQHLVVALWCAFSSLYALGELATQGYLHVAALHAFRNRRARLVLRNYVAPSSSQQ
jgi:hypothetical protein